MSLIAIDYAEFGSSAPQEELHMGFHTRLCELVHTPSRCAGGILYSTSGAWRYRHDKEKDHGSTEEGAEARGRN